MLIYVATCCVCGKCEAQSLLSWDRSLIGTTPVDQNSHITPVHHSAIWQARSARVPPRSAKTREENAESQQLLITITSFPHPWFPGLGFMARAQQVLVSGSKRPKPKNESLSLFQLSLPTVENVESTCATVPCFCDNCTVRVQVLTAGAWAQKRAPESGRDFESPNPRGPRAPRAPRGPNGLRCHDNQRSNSSPKRCNCVAFKPQMPQMQSEDSSKISGI